MVQTSNYYNAIAFTAAEDGNGRITIISADGNGNGTTLFSDQDPLEGVEVRPGEDGGAGNGPIYWGK
jgi:hypothetical protein